LENRHYKLSIQDLTEGVWLFTGVAGASLIAISAFAAWMDNRSLFKQTYLYGTSLLIPLLVDLYTHLGTGKGIYERALEGAMKLYGKLKRG
jgi:hypothetical protein